MLRQWVDEQHGERSCLEPVDCSYTVMINPDLTTASRDPLSASDVGDQRTVTDPAASAARKFYTVGIVRL